MLGLNQFGMDGDPFASPVLAPTGPTQSLTYTLHLDAPAVLTLTGQGYIWQGLARAGSYWVGIGLSITADGVLTPVDGLPHDTYVLMMTGIPKPVPRFVAGVASALWLLGINGEVVTLPVVVDISDGTNTGGTGGQIRVVQTGTPGVSVAQSYTAAFSQSVGIQPKYRFRGPLGEVLSAWLVDGLTAQAVLGETFDTQQMAHYLLLTAGPLQGAPYFIEFWNGLPGGQVLPLTAVNLRALPDDVAVTVTVPGRN